MLVNHITREASLPGSHVWLYPPFPFCVPLASVGTSLSFSMIKEGGSSSCLRVLVVLPLGPGVSKVPPSLAAGMV